MGIAAGAGRGESLEEKETRMSSEAAHPHQVHIGSCAWAFEDWRGVFYPPELPPGRWLGWYARTFNAVEIDSTFYATPPAHTVAKWLADAPAHFRFTCKAPKTITHELRLRGCNPLLAEFLERMEPLHGHMGPVLIQLPPSFAPAGDAAALREFVLGLPHGWKFAIEFRHAEWHQPRFARLLEDHGVCWVWSDMTPLPDQAQGPFGFLPETAPFIYLRLMGDPRTKFNAAGERIVHYREMLWPRAGAVESWAVRLGKQAEQAKGIYVFANNHYEGFAPLTCRRIAEHLGMKLTLPNPEAAEEEPQAGPRQMRLF
jgi:uncharacterized protein YecE (DUF72 family)